MDKFVPYPPYPYPADLEDVSPALVTAIVAVVTLLYLFARFTTAGWNEAAVNYDVPVPEQAKEGWKGEILSKPSLKVSSILLGSMRPTLKAFQVSGSSAIQCYAPTTGANLGLVNPATPDGIDRAITKAAEAQKEWCTTTFAQRRKVLKTMLKYALLPPHLASGR
jgi:Aldehyde dehydrogenase family